MKFLALCLHALGCCAAVAPAFAQTNQPTILPDPNAQNPHAYRLVWPAEPGLGYEVQQSTNLHAWTTVPGYPAVASAAVQAMSFIAG